MLNEANFCCLKCFTTFTSVKELQIHKSKKKRCEALRNQVVTRSQKKIESPPPRPSLDDTVEIEKTTKETLKFIEETFENSAKKIQAEKDFEKTDINFNCRSCAEEFPQYIELIVHDFKKHEFGASF